MTGFQLTPVPSANKKETETPKGKNRLSKVLLSFALVSSAAAAGPVMSPSAATEVASYYIVQKGDTFYSIAKKYGLVVEQLMAANFTTSTKIIVGQKIAIPHKNQSWSGNQEDLDARNYQVVKGDTLYSISKRTGVSIDSIKRMNNLTSDLIMIGQVLTLYPDVGVIHRTSATYYVKSGDTKYTLRNKFGNTVTLPSGELQVLQPLKITGKVLELTTEEPFGLADGRVIEVKVGSDYYAVNLYQGNEPIQHLADRNDLRLTFTVVRVGERYEMVSYAVQQLE
ncbi:LysM peptidoglycan-binding domain-containing protein [Planococcus sp. CP5-4]|uniref:LysM peptidoglycan-binding domain-containing protein n=1 Tax=unclassified Planococcus (in: firmicutes) TaxID=2662419 RepID=UPI001C215310|nr:MULTISPECIES: LysM peptidoglycan-binding domain-containing protein [unclassified Planococcus (in: firmicutes)]MBU9673623.1 LysM peptidoglycan-binding domain-containing protein [Planococcus sp. CP5-4_YE]MBV0907913.1 LysM peptidoglycan-binding domain-containing protein [Planococcus sp. CP5-4_UN]MBW6063080.1 LysM peptidoglycan-binding domain-containing protein [Planococcus sp. CP5-4]